MKTIRVESTIAIMNHELQEFQDFNFDNPILEHARFCKSITPRNDADRRAYNGRLPRIVKSNFKVAANWDVLRRVEDGEDMGGGWIHTCSKPYEDCIDGFWVINTNRRSGALPPIRVISIAPGDFD